MPTADNLEFEVVCPYCGEQISVWIDPCQDAGQWVEDCCVCCRPIEIRFESDAGGARLSVTTDSD